MHITSVGIDLQPYPCPHCQGRAHSVRSSRTLCPFPVGVRQTNGMAREATALVTEILLYLLTDKQDNRCMGKKPNPHAQALGSLGGKARAENLSEAEIAKIASKGGKARAQKLSAAERRRIAKLAVAARETGRKGER